MIAGYERCDQTPPEAKVPTPTEPKDGIPFELIVDNKGSAYGKYLPDQTYIGKAQILHKICIITLTIFELHSSPNSFM